MNFLKKALPHIVALVIFAAVSALFFAPQYSNKALRQGDMIRASGMGQDIKEHIDKYDQHPQWAGNMFSGMPAYLIDMNYDGRYVKYVGDQAYFLGTPAAYMFVAMASFYLMLLMFGCNPWLGIIGGLAYGLSTYFPIIIEAGHITKMLALAWIPGLIGAIFYAYRKNRYLGATLAGLFAAMEISTSHPQITYYFLFLIIALIINELVIAIKTKTVPKFLYTSATLGIAAILAIGANLVQLYYVADHSAETIRGKSELQVTADSGHATSGLDKDYATQWSYGKIETFNLFIPNFVGGGSSGGFAKDGEVAHELEKVGAKDVAQYLPSYWGDQPFTEGPVYIGALIIFLCVLGLFVLEKSNMWWLFATAILAIILAWGHNLMWLTDLMLDYFPLYNKFRVPSMILVVVELIVPLIGILALQKILFSDITKEKLLHSLKWATIICGGFALLSALIFPALMDFAATNDFSSIAGMFGIGQDAPAQHKQVVSSVVAAMESERASLMRMDAWRSLAFVILGAATLYLYYKGALKKWYAIALLAVFVTVDLFMVDRRFVKIEDFQPKSEAMAIEPTNNDLQILQDTTNYRVVNMTVNPFMDGTTPYFHRTVGGYHAAKLRRYQDLIEYHLSKNNFEAYNMLNTKYFITQQGVVENPDAAGNAWFVDEVKYVNTPDQEIAALGDSTFTAAKIAIVDKRFESQISGINITADSTATIELTQYRVNSLTYKYNAAQEGIVIFSEIYYPKGWKAYIDDKEADYFRADYVLRAMKVPAGEHKIEWRFEAPYFGLMTAITRISSLILLLGAITMIVLKIIKLTTKKDEN